MTPQTPSQLEVAARALAAAYAEIIHDNQNCDTWEDVSEEERERVRQMTRRVISSLVEPSEEVVEAMRSAYLVTTPEGLADTDMKAAFTAALQSILGEKP